MYQAPPGLTTVTIRVDTPPEMFWQSMPCPTCGAAIGQFCTYPSGRPAHTRHAQRDTLVIGASTAAVRDAASSRLANAAAAQSGRQADETIRGVVADIAAERGLDG